MTTAAKNCTTPPAKGTCSCFRVVVIGQRAVQAVCSARTTKPRERPNRLPKAKRARATTTLRTFRAAARAKNKSVGRPRPAGAADAFRARRRRLIGGLVVPPSVRRQEKKRSRRACTACFAGTSLPRALWRRTPTRRRCTPAGRTGTCWCGARRPRGPAWREGDEEEETKKNRLFPTASSLRSAPPPSRARGLWRRRRTRTTGATRNPSLTSPWTPTRRRGGAYTGWGTDDASTSRGRTRSVTLGIRHTFF